jgi:hypothetical protein
MDIRISVRGRSVVASGVIHTSGNSPIDFHINGMPLQVRFYDDFNDQTVRYFSTVENGGLVLTLFNFSLVTGEGMYEPIPITVVDGLQLFLAFSVGTANRFMGLRTFSFTLFHGQ